MKRGTQYFSIGYIAQQRQSTVSAIHRACAENNIAPAIEMNGVPYFDLDGYGELSCALCNNEDASQDIRFKASDEIRYGDGGDDDRMTSPDSTPPADGKKKRRRKVVHS